MKIALLALIVAFAAPALAEDVAFEPTDTQVSVVRSYAQFALATSKLCPDATEDCLLKQASAHFFLQVMQETYADSGHGDFIESLQLACGVPTMGYLRFLQCVGQLRKNVEAASQP